MKKNNTKVELKKYLSQKEKIKNTFISSCIILVVLTFFIFITYSYFINKTGEIEVGNFNSSIPDVKIIKSENVENTNYQQMEFTIHNYSNTNTYSYNLNWKDKASGHFGQIYYKIPSKEYSHPVGIIKPNETKKIRLVTTYSISKPLSVDPNNGPWHVKLDSGYEYSKPKLEEGYKNIKYSPLSETTELTELIPYNLHGTYNNVGYLKPEFNENIVEYDLYIPENLPDSIIPVPSSGSKYYPFQIHNKLTNNGKLVGSIFNIDTPKEKINHKMDVYAEDGTYIKTYTIKNVISENMSGKINCFKIKDYQGNSLDTEQNSSGFPNNSNINLSIMSNPNGVEITLYITFLEHMNYIHGYNMRSSYIYIAELEKKGDSSFVKQKTEASSGEFINGIDSLKLKIANPHANYEYILKIYRSSGSFSEPNKLLTTYNIKLV